MEASDMVSAPNNHVSPNRHMIPNMLMSNRLVLSTKFLSFLLLYFFMECLIRTLITTKKMTQLKIRTAKIGTKKAPKNTPTSPMKQLKWQNREHKETGIYTIYYPTPNLQLYVFFSCGVWRYGLNLAEGDHEPPIN